MLSACHPHAAADFDVDFDSEKDLKTKSGAFGPLLPEKVPLKPTEDELREIAQLCDNLMLEFGIPPSYNPAINEGTWRKKFHPWRFIQTTISQQVPIEVTLKVLRSMDKQKEQIQNPYAWLMDVMQKEFSQYQYDLEIKAHEERKRGVGGLISLLRGPF